MKALCLDLDETLFDHRHACRMGISHLWDTYEELRVKSVEQLEQEFWVMLDRMYHEVLAGRMTAEASRLERIRTLYAGCGLLVAETELLASVERYGQLYREHRRAIPGALELLTNARERGCQIAVLTNGLTAVQRDKIDACGLTVHVDHLITSEDAGVKKPDARLFEQALARLGITPSDTVMIGDSWEADIVGAQGLGMRAIWLNRGRINCPDPQQATEVHSLHEVPALLGWT